MTDTRSGPGRVLYLRMGATSMVNPQSPALDAVSHIDAYDFADTDLSNVRGILVSMSADQRFLATQAAKFEEFIHRGGRVALMGHPVVKFLPKQGDFRTLDYAAPAELHLSPGAPHPVWTGVDFLDVSARRGITGFYARGYTLNHPPGAIITSRIGPEKLPVDYVYAHGRGRVLIHPGIELGVFADDGNTAARIHPQLIDWLMLR